MKPTRPMSQNKGEQNPKKHPGFLVKLLDG